MSLAQRFEIYPYIKYYMVFITNSNNYLVRVVLSVLSTDSAVEFHLRSCHKPQEAKMVGSLIRTRDRIFLI